MEIWLKPLEITDDLKYYNVLMELASYKNAYARPIPEKFKYDEFLNFLNVRIRLAKNENIPSNIIPTNTYWVMDKDIPIGYATLKHYTDFLSPGGHTGCTLLNSYQNKGIGLIVAKELETIALNELGLTEIIYTSKNENIQSQKSVEKIGGELVSIHNGYHYYKLDLIKKYNLDERKNK